MTQMQNLVSPSANAPTNNNATSAKSAADRTMKAPDSKPSGTEAAAATALTIKTGFERTVQSAKGVALVTCSDPTISAASVAANANGILRHGCIADLPVCAVSAIVFLHASGSRDAEAVKVYAAKDIRDQVLQLKHIAHCHRFNPLSPEGASLVMQHVKQDVCVFATVECRDLKRDDVIAVLAQLNAEAEKLDTLIVIYVIHTKKQDVTWLSAHCTAFVEVSKCEPGPGAQIAILLNNVTLAGWHQQGIGRVMVELSLGQNADWSYRTEPFIAERAVIRLAWYLAHKSVTFDEIKKVVGLDKSNISRGLQGSLIQPKNSVGLAPPTGWTKRWASLYAIDDVRPRKDSDKGTTENDAITEAPTLEAAKTHDVDQVVNGALAPPRAVPEFTNRK